MSSATTLTPFDHFASLHAATHSPPGLSYIKVNGQMAHPPTDLHVHVPVLYMEAIGYTIKHLHVYFTGRIFADFTN